MQLGFELQRVFIDKLFDLTCQFLFYFLVI